MECRKQVADGQVHRTVMLPTVDFCFKELMLNERVRKSFIAALLDKTPKDIREVKLLPTILRKEYKDDKVGILVPTGVNTPLYSTRYPRQLHVCESSRSPATPSIHRRTPDADIRHYISTYLRREALSRK